MNPGDQEWCSSRSSLPTRQDVLSTVIQAKKGRAEAGFASRPCWRGLVGGSQFPPYVSEPSAFLLAFPGVLWQSANQEVTGKQPRPPSRGSSRLMPRIKPPLVRLSELTQGQSAD